MKVIDRTNSFIGSFVTDLLKTAADHPEMFLELAGGVAQITSSAGDYHLAIKVGERIWRVFLTSEMEVTAEESAVILGRISKRFRHALHGMASTIRATTAEVTAP